jgi:hypothetical protein
MSTTTETELEQGLEEPAAPADEGLEGADERAPAKRKSEPREYVILEELDGGSRLRALDVVRALSQEAAVQAFADAHPEFEGTVHAPLARSLSPSWPIASETVTRATVGERRT